MPALNPDFLYAALDATAYAAFVKESRKKRAGATKLHRKSGEALDPESRLFHRALKRSFPRINAGAPTTNLDKRTPSTHVLGYFQPSPFGKLRAGSAGLNLERMVLTQTL